MKRVDFIEKVFLTLGFFIEVLAGILLFSFLSSCKVKKQAESRLNEKNEIQKDVKTSETVRDSTVNVTRNFVSESEDMDIYAILRSLKFSEPDSLGNQYVKSIVIADFSNRSKKNVITETVDSASATANSLKLSEDNSKIKTDTKAEIKEKSETDSKGWQGVVTVILLALLSGLAVFVVYKFKK